MILAQRDGLAARVDLLAWRGAQTQGEGVEEIKRLKGTAGEAGERKVARPKSSCTVSPIVRN